MDFKQNGGYHSANYGSHVPIAAPGNLNTDYYNHKGRYSMLIQGLVDADYYF